MVMCLSIYFLFLNNQCYRCTQAFLTSSENRVDVVGGEDMPQLPQMDGKALPSKWSLTCKLQQT